MSKNCKKSCCWNGSPPKYSERSQCISFDGGCINTNRCNCDSHRIWPPLPPSDFIPKIICRDCGCIFQEYFDCYIHQHPPTPDFSSFRSNGYQLEISQPNSCNEIYFNVSPCRCIPPRVCCRCPLCRRGRVRPGDHFRDCSCIMCIQQKSRCKNSIRRQLLSENIKYCHCCGRKTTKIPPCCIPLPTSKFYGKENQVPRGKQIFCPCHLFLPKNWEIIKACEQKKEYDEIMKNQEDQIKAEKIQEFKTREKIWEYLTESLGQTIWILGPEPICKEHEICKEWTCDDQNDKDGKNIIPKFCPIDEILFPGVVEPDCELAKLQMEMYSQENKDKMDTKQSNTIQEDEVDNYSGDRKQSNNSHTSNETKGSEEEDDISESSGSGSETDSK